jgi:hypothetical protein
MALNSLSLERLETGRVDVMGADPEKEEHLGLSVVQPAELEVADPPPDGVSEVASDESGLLEQLATSTLRVRLRALDTPAGSEPPGSSLGPRGITADEEEKALLGIHDEYPCRAPLDDAVGRGHFTNTKGRP